MHSRQEIEDIASNKTKIELVIKRQEEESKKHEDYRDAVHGRINEVNNSINLLRRDISERMEKDTRRVDSLEMSLNNQDKLLQEFKIFGKEVADAITGFKEYIAKKDAKDTFARQLVKYVIQLAGFVVALLTIIKFAVGN